MTHALMAPSEGPVVPPLRIAVGIKWERICSSWCSTKYVAGVHSTNTKWSTLFLQPHFRWHWLVPIITILHHYDYKLSYSHGSARAAVSVQATSPSVVQPSGHPRPALRLLFPFPKAFFLSPGGRMHCALAAEFAGSGEPQPLNTLETLQCGLTWECGNT